MSLVENIDRYHIGRYQRFATSRTASVRKRRFVNGWQAK